MRQLLLSQLDLAWGFATRFVIGEVDRELALWEPSAHTITVHSTEDGWLADWPDEEHPPLPDATVGWLLWHIEWWWNNACDATEGRPARKPDEVVWSGSADGIVATHDRWRGILTRHDLDLPVPGLMPEPRPFWFVASWVNFELTKNLSEINQLKLQRANRPRPSDRSQR